MTGKEMLKGALSKISKVKNGTKRLIKKAIDYPFGGRINNPDYSEWAKNIRKGTPLNNLKKKK